MAKWNVKFSDGSDAYTDDKGRDLLLGIQRQREGPFVAIDLFPGLGDDLKAIQVEVNRDQVVTIRRA